MFSESPSVLRSEEARVSDVVQREVQQFEYHRVKLAKVMRCLNSIAAQVKRCRTQNQRAI